jgi:hypothetical protein
MRVEKIRVAVEMARLFARQGEELIQAPKKEEGEYLLFGSKQSASLRRLSMNLTRELAEMRKS